MTEGYSIDGVYFGDGDGFVNDVRNKGRLNVVYYPSVNSTAEGKPADCDHTLPVNASEYIYKCIGMVIYLLS